MSLPLLKNGQCHWTLIAAILELFLKASSI